jgi:hypothetical protein
MNERIRELWAQCVAKHTKDPMNWQTVADEFALLIVRECMRMCEVAETGLLTHSLREQSFGARGAKIYISDWFGVEE